MAAETLLASWNDDEARDEIVAFVRSVSSEGAASFVAPAERVAVFDNDGTLWSEKPIPVQLDFTLFRMAELARQDTALLESQPYKAAAERDYHWLGEAMVKHYHGDNSDLKLLMGAVESAFQGMGVEAFAADALGWLKTATHPQLHRPYLSCAFTPMVELLRYLEANGFTTYIASGGDRDFMRPFADQLYGIPPERVIGSALGLQFDEHGDETSLVYKSKIDFFDDGPEKPIRIWSRLGRRPLLACGNSNGDLPMLRFSRSVGRAALPLLVLHDDADREFAYTAGAEEALAWTKEHGTIVSVKRDWSAVFPAEGLRKSGPRRVADADCRLAWRSCLPTTSPPASAPPQDRVPKPSPGRSSARPRRPLRTSRVPVPSSVSTNGTRTSRAARSNGWSLSSRNCSACRRPRSSPAESWRSRPRSGCIPTAQVPARLRCPT
jgi:phosphoserine phosphatase